MTDGQMLRGVVHDPTARFMGGVAGHAACSPRLPTSRGFAGCWSTAANSTACGS